MKDRCGWARGIGSRAECAGPETGRARLRSRLVGGARGSAAVELAILLPLLTMITFGVIDFARVMYSYIAVASAAHETATYFAENPTATDATLQAVAVAESQNLSRAFLAFGGTPNATLTKVTTFASGTSNTDLFVRVQVTYSFGPLARIPVRGPVAVSAIAAAPRSRALT
jgi:Flp pilus assembly protein TadG